MTSYRQVIDTLEREGELDEASARQVRESLSERLVHADESRLIAAVAGVGAWLTSLFVLGFVLTLGVAALDGPGLLAFTVLSAGVAVAMDRFEAFGGVFVSQSVLAASAAAQLVVPFATESWPAMGTVIIQLVVSGSLYALLGSKANRALSAAILIGVSAGFSADASLVGYFLVFGSAFGLVCAVFGLDRELSWRVRRLLRPAAYVCVVGALVMSIAPLVNELAADANYEFYAGWLLQGIAALFAFGVVGFHVVADEENERAVLLTALATTAVLGALTSSGVFVALLVAALGFWKLDRILIVLGGLGVAGHLAIYYHQLDITLLEKSIALVISGLILLGIRWWYGSGEPEEAA